MQKYVQVHIMVMVLIFQVYLLAVQVTLMALVTGEHLTLVRLLVLELVRRVLYQAVQL